MSKNEVEKQLALENFEKALPGVIEKAEHSELYGHDLNTAEQGVKEILLKKFLQANNYELEAAKTQLLKTLKWRKSFCPLSAAFKETHNEVLDSIGLVTKQNDQVITWNLYGVVKDRKTVFGDLDAFLRWRVGLMELGLSTLDFSDESKSKMSQVHDYYSVSFLKLDSQTKAASSKTIHIFQDYYPEALDKKYFVNVPTIMGWVFTLVKPLVSKETLEKFHVLSDGAKLAGILGDWVPKAYGGKAESLDKLRLSDFTPVNSELVEKDYERRQAEKTKVSSKEADAAAAGETEKQDAEESKTEEEATEKPNTD